MSFPESIMEQMKQEASALGWLMTSEILKKAIFMHDCVAVGVGMCVCVL